MAPFLDIYDLPPACTLKGMRSPWVTIALLGALYKYARSPARPVPCARRPRELRADDPLSHALFAERMRALQTSGAPFVVRNASAARATAGALAASRCGAAAPNDMARQTREALAHAARLGRAPRLVLDAFLALRCRRVGGGACSLDAIASAYPTTLGAYVRAAAAAAVVPFGAFAGDRVFQWAMGDIGLALLLDWSCVLSGTDDDLDGGAAAAPACARNAELFGGLLGARTTADAFADAVVGRFNGGLNDGGGNGSGVGSGGSGAPHLRLRRGASLDVFVTAGAAGPQHHNLLHVHRVWCDGAVSAAWQLDGRKDWRLYGADAADALGPPSARSECCDTCDSRSRARRDEADPGARHAAVTRRF